MHAPSKSLIDELIDYAEECGLSFGHAAAVVAEFAKQRAPELTVESRIRDARHKIRLAVQNSAEEFIVARFLVRTRVRYVSWSYYPEYHVVDAPCTFWWCSIRYEEPDWKRVSEPNRFYLDDLFHDADWGRFWMKEPYLDGLPESAALFSELTDSQPKVLEGTSFRKVDPRVIETFKEKRNQAPEFTTRPLDYPLVSRRPPYGTKGWQNRVKLVPITYKRVRLR